MDSTHPVVRVFYTGPIDLTELEVNRILFEATKCGCGVCFYCVIAKELSAGDHWVPLTAIH